MTQDQAQETGDDLHSRNRVKQSDENSSYNNSKVQPLLPLKTTDGGKRSGGYPAYGAAMGGDKSEYAVGIMDGNGWTCEGRNGISGEHHINYGGMQANAAR